MCCCRGYDLCEFQPLGPFQTAHPDNLDRVNGLMRAFTYGTMGPFWDDRRQYIDRRYVGLEPASTQFRTIERDETTMEKVGRRLDRVGWGLMDEELRMEAVIGWVILWVCWWGPGRVGVVEGSSIILWGQAGGAGESYGAIG